MVGVRKFAVPDMTAENVAHLLIDEIIPRFGTPLEIVTDNCMENVNQNHETYPRNL